MEDPIKSMGDAAVQVVGKVLEHAPVYKDVLQPAARASGEGLAGLTKDFWGYFESLRGGLRLATKRNRLQETRIGQMLQQEYERIPEERRQLPPPYVAGPAFQAMEFVENEPNLRELYSKLLGKAMDSEKVRYAHPAFVEIIKQLTPDEARIVRVLAARGSIPVMHTIDWKGDVADEVWAVARESDCRYPEFQAAYIANLIRLGILHSVRQQPNPDELLLFEVFDTDPLVIEANKTRMGLYKGMARVTPFGHQFCEACS